MIELVTFDNKRLLLKIPRVSFRDWLQRLRDIVGKGNARIGAFLSKNGFRDDELRKDVSDVNAMSLSETTSALFGRLREMKRGIANARMQQDDILPFSEVELARLRSLTLAFPLLDMIKPLDRSDAREITGIPNADYLEHLVSEDGDIEMSITARVRSGQPPNGIWKFRLFGKRWRRAQIALWKGSVVLSFKNKKKFSLWSRLRGRDRTLGKADACIDLETVIGIREIDFSHDGRCIELCTFDGCRMHLAIPESSFDAWYSRLAGIIAGNNARMYTHISKTGQGDDNMLLRHVSDISVSELSESTLAIFLKLVDLKKGTAGARAGDPQIQSDNLKTSSQLGRLLSPLLHALTKLLSRSRLGADALLGDDEEEYLRSIPGNSGNITILGAASVILPAGK